jgi:hypothetical protein
MRIPLANLLQPFHGAAKLLERARVPQRTLSVRGIYARSSLLGPKEEGLKGFVDAVGGGLHRAHEFVG